ncbi:MAG TPA: BON domain-containing protein [Blastocatellia bacterium]|nr:BON domain-containing protein [Blastocatellia bacterium]
MKRLFIAASVITLMSLLTLSAAAQEMTAKKPKAAKPAKAAAAPKSDADIQKCISDKLAASKTVTNGSAAVSDGVATLTGEASSAGAKGGATRSAKACGAKSVTNNITVAAKPKPAPPQKKP